MTPFDKPHPEAANFTIPQEGKSDPILGRVDLIAILTAALGFCLLGVGAVVLAILEVAKLIAGMWSNSFDRWLVIAFGLAIVWIIARRKKLCVF